MEVGIREFKNRMSEYLDRLKAGEVITLTKRGRRVARIVAVDRSPGLSALVSSGRVRWSGTRPQVPRAAPLEGAGKTMAEYVAEVRR